MEKDNNVAGKTEKKHLLLQHEIGRLNAVVGDLSELVSLMKNGAVGTVRGPDERKKEKELTFIEVLDSAPNIIHQEAEKVFKITQELKSLLFGE